MKVHNVPLSTGTKLEIIQSSRLAHLCWLGQLAQSFGLLNSPISGQSWQLIGEERLPSSGEECLICFFPSESSDRLSVRFLISDSLWVAGLGIAGNVARSSCACSQFLRVSVGFPFCLVATFLCSVLELLLIGLYAGKLADRGLFRVHTNCLLFCRCECLSSSISIVNPKKCEFLWLPLLHPLPIIPFCLSGSILSNF